MTKKHDANEYYCIYNSSEYLFRRTKESFKDDNINIKSKRLLECCYRVLSDNKHYMLLEIDNKSLYDLMDDIKELYLSNTEYYYIYEDVFQKEDRHIEGFIPFYNHKTRWKYHKELKQSSLLEITQALTLDVLTGAYSFGYTFWDDSFYFDVIDFKDYIDEVDTLDFLNNYSEFGTYYIYDYLYEFLFNMQYEDIYQFMKTKPTYEERLDYLEYINYDEREFAYESLNLTEDDLNKID